MPGLDSNKPSRSRVAEYRPVREPVHKYGIRSSDCSDLAHLRFEPVFNARGRFSGGYIYQILQGLGLIGHEVQGEKFFYDLDRI